MDNLNYFNKIAKDLSKGFKENDTMLGNIINMMEDSEEKDVFNSIRKRLKQAIVSGDLKEVNKISEEVKKYLKQ